MKIIEPISSALLLTGCVYSAGISQNNAFMRSFGVSPEFSQPAIDKIFYDGGLITFEIFYKHLTWITFGLLTTFAFLAIFISYAALTRKWHLITVIKNKTTTCYSTIAPSTPVGLITLLYIIFLCFSSYQKGQNIGVKLSDTFLDRCYTVIIKDKKDTISACAFRKDRDSIWYYQFNDGEIKINSRILTEIGQITYLEPKSNP